MSKPSTYIGVFLDQQSKDLIVKHFGAYVPEGWGWFNDHVTIKYFGKPIFPEDFPEPYNEMAKKNSRVSMTVIAIGISDKAIAIMVSGAPSTNPKQHITLATPNGKNPVASNDITNWKDVTNITISGIIAANNDAPDLLSETDETSDTLVPFTGNREDSLDGTDVNNQAWAPPVMHVKMGNMEESVIKKLTLQELTTTFPANVGTVDATYDSWTDQMGDKNVDPEKVELDAAKIELNEIEYTDIAKLPFLNAIEKIGGKVYQVGGSVRDSFIGKKSKDLDIMVTGLTPEQLDNALKPYGKVNLVGQSFGVIKFKPHGAMEDIDIALARTDKKVGTGHKGIEVFTDPSITVEQDIFRRDFTINSIAKDIHGNLIDPYHGQEDLKNRIIRMTSPEAFAEDPLRMLRAVQFAARFHFTIEPNTFNTIRQHAADIKSISAERLLEEFNKIIHKGSPAIGAKLLVDTGLYKHIFNADYTGDYTNFDQVKRMSEFIYLLTKDSLQSPADYFKKHLKGDLESYKELKVFELTKNEINTPTEERWLLNKVQSIAPDAIGSFILQDKIKDISIHPEEKYPRVGSKIAISSDEIMPLGIKDANYGRLVQDLLQMIYNDELPNEHNAILAYIQQNQDKYKAETEKLVKKLTENVINEIMTAFHGIDETSELQEIAYQVLDRLWNHDISCFVSNVAKTGSVYIQFYNKQLGKLRISRHAPGSSEVQFNISPSIKTFRRERKNDKLYYYYGVNYINTLVEIIKKYDMQSKQQNNEQVIKEITQNLLLEFSDADALRLEKAALAHYGEAPDYKAAAYITPNGYLLDFSEGRGSREQDHRNIEFLFDELNIDKEKYGAKEWETSHSGGMYAVMDMGFIRFMPEANMIEMHQMPYQDQFKQLRDIIRREDGKVLVEVFKAGSESSAVQYEKGTSVDYIITGIKNYYREGMLLQPYGYADDKDLYEEDRKETINGYRISRYFDNGQNRIRIMAPNLTDIMVTIDIGQSNEELIATMQKKFNKPATDILSEGAIKNPHNFKITFEDVKYKEVDGVKYYTEWTGYGMVDVPFLGWKPMIRGTRPTVFKWALGRKVFVIDVRDYIRHNLDKVKNTTLLAEISVESNNNMSNLVEEFKNRVPSLRKYNQHNNENGAEFQLTKPLGTIKVYWTDKEVYLKNAWAISEFFITYRHFNEKKWYYFTFKNELYFEPPKNYDQLTQTVLNVARQQINEKLSYRKELVIHENENYSQQDIDNIINEINKKTFEFDDYLSKYTTDTLFEETKITKKELINSVIMEAKRNKIWRLVIFDMDSTLIDSPQPEFGRAEWKQKTGKEFPYPKNWWSKPESLDTTVFDIKAVPPVFNQMRDEQKRSDTMVIIMTNRLDALEREVKRVLKQNRINPDLLSMAEYHEQNKGDRVLDLLKIHPDIKYVSFYDDSATNIENVRMALKGKGITYDMYNCQDGKIRRA